MMFNSEIMGNREFPKLWMQPKMIYALGSGRWGTLLRATNANDWQLYLMSKEEINFSHVTLAPPNFVVSESLQPKLIPNTVLSDPSELYLYTLARKCPNIISKVTQHQVHLKNSVRRYS